MKTGLFLQVKPFNSSTVTQEVAAEICAIVGLWKHYTELKYMAQGFEIVERFEGKLPNGGTLFLGNNATRDNYLEKGAEMIPAGIVIIPKCGTRHQVRIFENGHAYCECVWKKGDWKGSSPGKGNEYYEDSGRAMEVPYNSLKYVSKLIELGFFEFKTENKNG